MIEIKSIKSCYNECCNCYDRKNMTEVSIGDTHFYLCEKCLNALHDAIDSKTLDDIIETRSVEEK